MQKFNISIFCHPLFFKHNAVYHFLFCHSSVTTLKYWLFILFFLMVIKLFLKAFLKNWSAKVYRSCISFNQIHSSDTERTLKWCTSSERQSRGVMPMTLIRGECRGTCRRPHHTPAISWSGGVSSAAVFFLWSSKNTLTSLLKCSVFRWDLNTSNLWLACLFRKPCYNWSVYNPTPQGQRPLSKPC